MNNDSNFSSSPKTPALPRYQAPLAVVLILTLCAVRFLHLGADTPTWVAPYSAGEYVDEGNKTLSPRNLVVHGHTHWNDENDYRGWMKSSPITNWSYFAAYSLLEPKVEAARLATALYFVAFLAVTFLALRRHVSTVALFVGLILLSVDSGIFFFSRIAIFEMPMITLLYAGTLMLAHLSDDANWLPLALLIGLSAILAFGIKASGVVYTAPAIAGLILRFLYTQRNKRWGNPYLIALVAALPSMAILYATRHIWLARLGLNPQAYLSNFLSTPVLALTPFLTLAGIASSLHLLFARFESIVASSYRTALISMAIGGPLALALFTTDPPRYWVPIIPAFALVVCEWLILRPWHKPREKAPFIITIAVAIASLALAYLCARAAKNLLSNLSPEQIPTSLLAHGFWPILPAFAILAVWLICVFKTIPVPKNSSGWPLLAFAALSSLSVMHSSIRIFDFSLLIRNSRPRSFAHRSSRPYLAVAPSQETGLPYLPLEQEWTHST